MVRASHWVGLTLPGMMDEPGSFSGSDSSPRPERGPEPRSRMSLAILNSETATVLMAPCDHDHRVMGGQRLELVGRRGEGHAGDGRDAVRHQFGEADRRIEAGADGGAALRQFHQHGHGLLDARDAVLHLLGIAGEFLAQRQRRGILRVGAADLDDVAPGLGLGVQRLVQVPERRDQVVLPPVPHRRCAWRWDRCRSTTGSC